MAFTEPPPTRNHSFIDIKGAVPITLATYPLMSGIDGASKLFDVIFFVVLLSAAVQGWTLPPLARRLGLEMPPEPRAPLSLEISSLQDVDGDIVDYTVGPRSRAAGRQVQELALPEGVVIAVVARDQKMIPPHGGTLIQEGDHVILVLRPALRGLVDRVFAGVQDTADKLPPQFEFPLRGTATVGQLQEFYGISVDSRPEVTLGAVLREGLGAGAPLVDRAVRFGEITLCVRDVAPDGTILRIGMIVGAAEEIRLPSWVQSTRFSIGDLELLRNKMVRNSSRGSTNVFCCRCFELIKDRQQLGTSREAPRWIDHPGRADRSC